MSVHYKFKSSLDFDTITFDGLHISVGELRKAILHSKKIGKNSDFDLQITHAQTKEIYSDGSVLIPKNTSVIVARIPTTGQTKKPWERNNDSSSSHLDRGNSSPGQQNEKLSRTADLVNANASEHDKIMAMINQSSREYDPSNYIKSSSMSGPLPTNYTCYRCGKPGHWIKNCPTNSIDVKRSTGIPRSFMVTVNGPEHKGAYLTSTGQYAIPVINREAYNDTAANKGQAPVEEVKEEIPEELLCMLCKNLLNDAVLIPCCGNSYCDECIRQCLLDSENHECPTCHDTDVSPDNLIPTRSLRTAVKNYLNKAAMKMKRNPISEPQIEKEPEIQKPASPAPVQEPVAKEVGPVDSPKPVVEAPTVVVEKAISAIVEEKVLSVATPSPNPSEKAESGQKPPPEDDRPGTPLADEAPISEPTDDTPNLRSVSSLPPMSSVDKSEPQPPGISSSPDHDQSPSHADNSGIQVISTLTTRGPPSAPHLPHHQSSSHQYPRHRKPGGPHHSHRYSSRDRQPYPPATSSSYSYMPPTNVPPPGYPSEAFPPPGTTPHPAGPYPPPPHIPPPHLGGPPLPPGIPGYPPPYGLPYPHRRPHSGSGFGYSAYDPSMRDPYDEFKRKMREKDARDRRRYPSRRSRSRSRSRSKSYGSRSRSRSFSRSLSRSPVRSPSRYRRKSPLVVSRHRHHDSSAYDERRRARRPRSRSPGAIQSEFQDRDRYKTQSVRQERDHPRYSDSRYTSSQTYKSYRYEEGQANPGSYGSRYAGDRPSSQDVRNYDGRNAENGHGYADQYKQEGRQRSASPRTDRRNNGSKMATEDDGRRKDKEQIHSRRGNRSTKSPELRRSPKHDEKKVHVSSPDEKKSKSAQDKHKKHKKKNKNKKDEEFGQNSENSGCDSAPVSEDASKNSAAKAESTDAVKEKKHKHKKRRDKSKDLDETKKKKKKKVKVEAVDTAVDVAQNEEAAPGEPVAEELAEPKADVQIDENTPETENIEAAEAESPKLTEKAPEAQKSPIHYVPELSKWEREDDDLTDDKPTDDGDAWKTPKQTLSSDIIERAEKVILSKPVKPSTIASVPVIVKTSQDRKLKAEANDKANRVVSGSERIKITISNEEKKSNSSESSKQLSRRKIDRSKFYDTGSTKEHDRRVDEEGPKDDKYRHRRRSRSPRGASKHQEDQRRSNLDPRDLRNHISKDTGDDRGGARSRDRKDQRNEERKREESSKSGRNDRSFRKKSADASLKVGAKKPDVLEDVESQFVPDYDGSSDEDASSEKPKAALKSEVISKKKDKMSDSSSDDSGSESEMHRKRKRHDSSDSDKKKHKKSKKDKKHKKHKKKKSKSKHKDSKSKK